MKQTVSGNIKCFDISCSDEDIKRLQQYYIKHCGEHFEILTGGRGHSRTKEIIEDMQNEIERLNNIIKIMEKYFELIIDLGYDYDGLNEEKSLKKLIDELCKYASLGRAYNITEPIYENENKKYNILHEELKESGNNE